MKEAIFILALSSLTCHAQKVSSIAAVNTPEEARNFAKNTMWAQVQVLPESEVNWIFEQQGEADGLSDKKQEVAIVRNTAYKRIADTTLIMVNCAIIDLPYTTTDKPSVDSMFLVLTSDFKRFGSFERLVDEHLKKSHLTFGYEVFARPSGELTTMTGIDLSTTAKGTFLTRDLAPEMGAYLLIYVKDEPVTTKAAIVLKARIE